MGREKKRRRIKKKRQSHQRKRVTKKRREGMKMKMKIMQSSPKTTAQGAPPEQHKLSNRKNILSSVIAITNLRSPYLYVILTKNQV